MQSEEQIMRTYPSNIATTFSDSHGNSRTEVSLVLLQSELSRIHEHLNALIDHMNFMHQKMAEMGNAAKFIDWINLVHPELKRDYVISGAVASRLADDGPDQEAVMVSP